MKDYRNQKYVNSSKRETTHDIAPISLQQKTMYFLAFNINGMHISQVDLIFGTNVLIPFMNGRLANLQSYVILSVCLKPLTTIYSLVLFLP